MADLMRIGVNLDPSGTQQGAAVAKKELQGVADAATKMQQGVDAASKKTGSSLAAAGSAGTAAGAAVAKGADQGAKGLSAIDPAAARARDAISSIGQAGGFLQRTLEFAFGGIIEKMAEMGAEAIISIPKEAIEAGIEYDDMVKRVTISIAGMIAAQRGNQIGNFNDAIKLSSQVVDVLNQKVLQFHFAGLDPLAESFTAVATATNGWGLSLRQQIDLTTQFATALQSKGFTGAMAMRDTMDILMGRGERTLAGKELFGVDLEKFSDGVATTDEKVKMIYDHLGKYQEAAAHGNDVLSISWAALKGQLDHLLGDTVKPLYDELVTQVNRVREVISGSNFAQAMAPFVSLLKQAAEMAGDLAVALAINPTGFLTMLVDGSKAAFQTGVEWLVSEIPRIQPPLEKAMRSAAQIFMDMIFQAAAILDASVASLYAQNKSKIDVAADNVKLGAMKPGRDMPEWLGAVGGWDVFPPTDDKEWNDAIAKRDKDQRIADQGYNADEMGDTAKGYLKGFQNQAFTMQHPVAQPLVGPPAPQPNAPTSDDLWAKYHADVAGTNVEVQKYLDNMKKVHDLVGPPKPSDLDVAQTGSTTLSAKQQQENALQADDIKIANDKLSILKAQATANQTLISQAENLEKTDEYHKALLSEMHYTDLPEINRLTAQYASSLKEVVGSRQQDSDLQKQINLAEEAATAARGNTQTIQQNPFLSNLTKRPELIASYDEEISKLQQVIKLNQEAISNGSTRGQAAIAQRQKEIDNANKEIITAQTQRSLQTDSGIFGSDITKYMDSLGTAGSRVANVITGTLNTAIQSTSDNIMKVINGTESWGQAFQNIGASILQTLEQLIIKMLLMQALQSAMGGAGVGGARFAAMFAGGAHSGGVWGQDPPTFVRSLPKFHQGGVASDESLAVVKKDESILTPAQMKAVSGGGATQQSSGNPIHIHIMNVNDPSGPINSMRKNPDQLINILGQAPSQVRAVIGIR